MSWDRWRPEIAKACDGSHHTIESIETSILAGRAHLFGGEGYCFVVEVAEYPTEKACQIMWAAGTLPEIIAGLPQLERWARDNQCTEMLVEGHPGWARALRNDGYRPWSVTVRKAL